MTTEQSVTPQQPFSSAAAPIIDEALLHDLGERVARARRSPSAAPICGVGAERVAALAATWRDAFDWRSFEKELADLGSAVTTTADGRHLHFLHSTPTSAKTTRMPLLLLHGWPDTPLQFRHLIPLLLAAGHPIVAPTAAGFGWSDEPAGELSAELVAADVKALMEGLGYRSYVVHGTDWGATVGTALVDAAPEAVAGLHLLQPPFDRLFMVDRSTASEAEAAYFARVDAWSEKAAYISAHSHQADTLAAALDDSPVGLLAWLGDKYDAWSGDGIQDEDILAATSMMWLTGTFRSSVRLYSEPAGSWGEDDGGWAVEAENAEWGAADWAPAKVEVPTAFAIFPQDIGTPPRDFCERFFAVSRFTAMPRGGHWAALEEPQLVADDLIAFAHSL